LTSCFTLEQRKEEMLKKVFTNHDKIGDLEKIQAELQDKYHIHGRLLLSLQQELSSTSQQFERNLDPDTKMITKDTSREGTAVSKDTPRSHRGTAEDLLAICRAVEACNAECNMLNKSIESIANAFARLDTRLQSVEEGIVFETGSNRTMSAKKESMNSLESNLEPELTDVQVIVINSSSFRASGRANSDSSGVKVSAITDKALV